ncbi:GRB2-associated-binding protein 3-like [Physella acuta]|uniref:GRB2-associated-binding protein 3-like n=1 Tax=Physella acuta TaxID=109671 RepID=UPI0027DCED42|nr:GRB2-associated-binding protein 3-like [Physella acuta]
MALSKVLHNGWLTKSPPEKKMNPTFKLFRSQWKKRFFVLRQNTLDSKYELTYYKDQQCLTKKGSVNLESCEQVIESLQSDVFPHLLAVKTYKKNKPRTYYLAAQDEAQMKLWIHWLCLVCHLKTETQPRDSMYQPFTHLKIQNEVSELSPLHVSTDNLAEVSSQDENSNQEDSAVDTPNAHSPQVNLLSDGDIMRCLSNFSLLLNESAHSSLSELLEQDLNTVHETPANLPSVHEYSSIDPIYYNSYHEDSNIHQSEAGPHDETPDPTYYNIIFSDAPETSGESQENENPGSCTEPTGKTKSPDYVHSKEPHISTHEPYSDVMEASTTTIEPPPLYTKTKRASILALSDTHVPDLISAISPDLLHTYGYDTPRSSQLAIPEQV